MSAMKQALHHRNRRGAREEKNMNASTKKTYRRELTLNELENVTGGADRESAPESEGNFISWIIDLLFGE